MNRWIFSSLFLLATVLGPTSARADHLLYGGVGNRGLNPGALLLIDSDDGSGVVVGDPVTPGGLSGVAFDSLGTLYGITVSGGFSSLVTIDPDLGTLLTSTPISDGRGPLSLGDLAVQPGTDHR